jgi:hypothetical protein
VLCFLFPEGKNLFFAVVTGTGGDGQVAARPPKIYKLRRRNRVVGSNTRGSRQRARANDDALLTFGEQRPAIVPILTIDR